MDNNLEPREGAVEEPVPEPMTEPVSEPVPEADTEPGEESREGPVPEPQAEPQTEPEAEPQAEAKAEPQAKRKKISGFLLGMIIYVWLLVSFGAVALWLLRDYLVEYENSVPSNYLEEYVTDLREQGLTKAGLKALNIVDGKIQSQEEAKAWAENLLAEASFPRIVNRSGPEVKVYSVRVDGQELGTVTFSAAETDRFGMTEWKLTEEKYDFSSYLQSFSVTVPADYRVVVNGVTLNRSYIIDKAVPYEYLSECYEHFDGLPYMVSYESGSWLGEVEIQVLNADGDPVAVEDLREELFLDNCGEELRARVEKFVPEFVERYIFFSSDMNGETEHHYAALFPYVVTGSPLSVRLQQAYEGFGFVTPTDLKFLGSQINLVTELEEGKYLVDVTYQTEITGEKEPVVTEEHVRIIVVDQKGSLKAEMLFVE